MKTSLTKHSFPSHLPKYPQNSYSRDLATKEDYLPHEVPLATENPPSATCRIPRSRFDRSHPSKAQVPTATSARKLAGLETVYVAGEDVARAARPRSYIGRLLQCATLPSVYTRAASGRTAARHPRSKIRPPGVQCARRASERRVYGYGGCTAWLLCCCARRVGRIPAGRKSDTAETRYLSSNEDTWPASLLW